MTEGTKTKKEELILQLSEMLDQKLESACWLDGERCPYGNPFGRFELRPIMFCKVPTTLGNGCWKLTGDVSSEIEKMASALTEEEVEKRVDEEIEKREDKFIKKILGDVRRNEQGLEDLIKKIAGTIKVTKIEKQILLIAATIIEEEYEESVLVSSDVDELFGGEDSI